MILNTANTWQITFLLGGYVLVVFCVLGLWDTVPSLEMPIGLGHLYHAPGSDHASGHVDRQFPSTFQ